VSHAALDEIERYIEQLEAALDSVHTEQLEIDAPKLDGDIAPGDLAKAKALAERLQAAHTRVAGQRVRLGGEIADLRRRRSSTSHRRGPSAFDTSM